MMIGGVHVVVSRENIKKLQLSLTSLLVVGFSTIHTLV